jgi:hypothetical protein
MTSKHRAICAATLTLFAAVLFTDRQATAQTNPDICSAISCVGGSQKCADVFATLTDERCGEGVMCCPFPEETVSYICYERSSGVL